MRLLIGILIGLVFIPAIIAICLTHTFVKLSYNTTDPLKNESV
jgi:hypothetical protein